MSHIYRNEVLVYLCLNNATAKPSLGSSFFVIENRSRKKKKGYLRLDSFEENITVSGLIKSKESWMKMYH